jgi:hypothetical protein
MNFKDCLLVVLDRTFVGAVARGRRPLFVVVNFLMGFIID